MSDYCQPPYVSASARVPPQTQPQPHRRIATRYTFTEKNGVDAELSHGADAVSLRALTFPSRNAALGGAGIGTCSQLQPLSGALRCRGMNDAPFVGFFFVAMLVTRVGRRGREKRAGRRGREKALRAKQLLIQSSTGEGDSVTSCRCCHGYLRPCVIPVSCRAPGLKMLPFGRRRKGTKGNGR